MRSCTKLPSFCTKHLTHTHCRLASLGEMQPCPCRYGRAQTPKKIDADMNNMTSYHKVTESGHQDESHPFRSSMMSKSRLMGTVLLWLWTKPSSAPNRSPSTITVSVPFDHDHYCSPYHDHDHIHPQLQPGRNYSVAVRAVSNEMESLARRVFVATSKQDHDKLSLIIVELSTMTMDKV